MTSLALSERFVVHVCLILILLPALVIAGFASRNLVVRPLIRTLFFCLSSLLVGSSSMLCSCLSSPLQPVVVRLHPPSLAHYCNTRLLPTQMCRGWRAIRGKPRKPFHGAFNSVYMSAFLAGATRYKIECDSHCHLLRSWLEFGQSRRVLMRLVAEAEC